MLVISRKQETMKNIWKVELRDSVIIVLIFLLKLKKKWKKHLLCCSGKAGFTFSFNNGKVIDYQDHYNNLGDMSFSVYFDFETTTGNVVFFLCKDVCGEL